VSHWIFQNTLDHWDLRVRLIEGLAGSYKVSRYRDQMAPGDTVFFWLAGPAAIRGIYGWGTLTSLPYFHRQRQEDVVDMKYEKRLRDPLLATEMRPMRELQSLSILRFHQGSNFAVSLLEARAIARLIEPDQRPPI
jgi:hypothetical protein